MEIVSFMGGGSGKNEDRLVLGGHEFTSRFILGSGKFSLDLVKACIEKAEAQIITLALRRANEGGLANILDYIPDNVTLLPNTSGARNAEEAVRIARLSRELGCGDFVKIEVIHDSKYLLPDNYETIKATEILAKEGFVVMPYMYPDLNAARDLVNAGAACVMPLGSPIGSNKGICTKEFIQILIDEIDLPIIVDAGIGKPSQACEAMEMGAAAVMAAEPVTKAESHKVSVAIAVVVIFGTLAIFTYPLFYTWSQHLINAHQFGIYVGSSVHEVAQVYAIGENIDPIVANTAVISKMIRVMMLAPFLLMLSWL